MFEYFVEIDASQPIAIEHDVGVIRVSFRHSAQEPINLDPLQPVGGYKLGVRLYTMAAENVLFEDRMKLAKHLLNPGETTLCWVEIPRALINFTTIFKLFVDVVREGEYWFSERSSSGTVVEICFAEKASPRVAVNPDPVGNADSRQLDLGGLDDVFSKFDFSNYVSLRRLQVIGASSQEISFQTPDSFFEIANRTRGAVADAKLPLTDFIYHTARIESPDTERLSLSRRGRFEIIRRFFDTGHQLVGGAEKYFSDDIVRYLNEMPLFDGFFSVPLSRLMLWYWMSEAKTISPDLADAQEDIHWWWVAAAMPANRVPGCFIPSEVIAFLSASHESFRNRETALSRFAFKAYVSSSELCDRYELTTRAGLIAYSFDFVIHNIAHPINCRFIGSGTKAFWQQISRIHGVDFTYFEVALCLNTQVWRDLLFQKADSDAVYRVREQLTRAVHARCPEFIELCTPQASRYRAPSAAVIGKASGRNARHDVMDALGVESIVVAGMTNSSSGLGTNSRMSQYTLEHMRIAPVLYDVDTQSFHRELPKGSLISLCHINADAVPGMVARDKTGSIARGPRIGFYLWELDTLPETHMLGIHLVDEIWVPSDFLQKIYASATSKVVRNVKKYIHIPVLDSDPPARRGPFRFLCSFDFHSGVERKNPFAVVRAFQAAFPITNRDVALTLKTTEFVHKHWGDVNNQWFHIREVAARDSRISIIVDSLPTQRFFEMIRDHDCVVSAHRAEGFGYLPAYGLMLEKPVIVTNFSGSTDFCNYSTSFPVEYRLVAVRPGEFFIDVAGAKWAEVNFDDLVANMRNVVRDSGEARKRAASGRSLMLSDYSLSAHAMRYESALRSFAGGSFGDRALLSG